MFVVIALVLVSLGIVYALSRPTKYRVLNDIAWANDRDVPTSQAVLLFRSIWRSHKMLEQGYNEYSRKNLPFVFANLFTGPEILLPISYMDWVHDQPETVLSSFETHRQFMRADWTFLHPTIFHEHVFEQVIKKQLTRHLDALTPDLADEALSAVISLSTASKDGSFELNDHAAWKRVTLQVVSRIYVGLPLCRNNSYLVDATTFNDLSMLVAAIIGIIPASLRPILAPLVVLRDRYYHAKCATRTKPIIEKRLELVQSDVDKAPNDLITWAIQDALNSSETDAYKRTPDFLAARISMMNFVSIDSTSITIENTLYDILANPQDIPALSDSTSSPNATLLDCIRAEAQAAYNRYHGRDASAWKSIINSLPLLDACLKESLRLNNFVSRTNVRMVMAPEGLNVPGVGHVPKGTNLGFSLWGMHHDNKDYGDAAKWRMTRWLESPEKENISVWGGGGPTFDQQYLPFGYRRHACPGRFFALRVVKLILIRMILLFDVEMATPSRPGNPWLGVSRGPPMGGRLIFRRRSAA